MTPRQCHAWFVLGAARHSRERGEMLADRAIAAQGSNDLIKKTVRELSES